MKKLFVAASVCLIAFSSFAYDPNTEVLKAFAQTFTNAKNIQWQEHSNYYTVSFDYSGVQSRVDYDKKGNIISSTRYYNPSKLPLNVLHKLKKQYPRQELYGVTEFTVADEMVYFVKMQDQHSWITLKVDPSGASEIYEKYKKG